MKHAILADTGPLYAAADPDDAHHRRAQQQIQRLRQDRRSVAVAWPTLLEAYTLILYRLGHSAASVWLNDVLAGVDLIQPTPEDYREATARTPRFADQRITLFDAVTAALATRLGMEVWTYDHHFDLLRVPVWR